MDVFTCSSVYGSVSGSVSCSVSGSVTCFVLGSVCVCECCPDDPERIRTHRTVFLQ